MARKRHVGWKTVWRIYPRKNIVRGCIKPVILLILTLPFFLISNNNAFYFLDLISQTILSTFPSLIGFILAGYTLIIGFSSSDIITYLSKFNGGKGYSIFQTVNSTFAITISIMILTFIIGGFCSFIIKSDIDFIFNVNASIIEIYNFVLLFLLAFMFYYSLCSLLDIVINIFNLGQFANILAKKKSNNKDNDTPKKE